VTRALAIVVMWIGAARADVVPDYSGTFPDTKLRLEAGLYLDFGDFAFAQDRETVGGLRGEVAAHLDRFVLAADYGWMWGDAGSHGTQTPSVQDMTPVDPGTRWLSMRRVGVEGRFTLAAWRTGLHTKHSHHIYQYARDELWVGAGVGREDLYEHDALVRLHDGRTTTALSFGIAESSRLPDRHADVGLRCSIARSTLPDGRTANEVTFTVGIALGN
jgi:hypothetical protein